MVISFANTESDGLNAIAYSLAFASHYQKDLEFILISEDVQNGNPSNYFKGTLLEEATKEYILAGKVHVFAEEDILNAFKLFQSFHETDTVIYASSLQKKYGHLRVLKELVEMDIPAFKIKVDTVFKPLSKVILPKEIKLLKTNQSLYQTLKNTYFDKKPIDFNITTKTKTILMNRIPNHLKLTEEIAAFLLLEQFNLQNLNQYIHRDPNSFKESLKWVSNNNILIENPPRFN